MSTETQRADLAELLQDNITDALPINPWRGEVREQVELAVQHVLAAGYRKPRTITTVEELDALQLPAIINARNGGPARVDYYYGPSQRKYVEYIFGENDTDYSLDSFAEFMGTATVLHEAATA